MINDTVDGAAAASGPTSPPRRSRATGPDGVGPERERHVDGAHGRDGRAVTRRLSICSLAAPASCDTAAVAITVSARPSSTRSTTSPRRCPRPVARCRGRDRNVHLDGATPWWATRRVRPDAADQRRDRRGWFNASGHVDGAHGGCAGSYTATHPSVRLAAPASCDTATVAITATRRRQRGERPCRRRCPRRRHGAVGRDDDTVDGATAVVGVNVSAPTLQTNGGSTGLVLNASGTLTVRSTGRDSRELHGDVSDLLARRAGELRHGHGRDHGEYAGRHAVNDRRRRCPRRWHGAVRSDRRTTRWTARTAVVRRRRVRPDAADHGGPTGLVLNASGTLTVSAGVTAGSYTATYQSARSPCPTSCDTATVGDHGQRAGR